MSLNALHTLFLPFEKGILNPPAGRAVFFGARAHQALAQFPDLQGVQHFFPYACEINLPAYDGSGGADMALVNLPKQKEEAQYDLACALAAIKTGGMVIAAAANDAGGNRIEKWMKEIGLKPNSLSKHKARVCWAVKEEEQNDTAQAWIERGGRQVVIIDDEEWISQPGVFGWDRADAGSQMLVDFIPEDLTGRGADFGCGYGYLSRDVLAHNEGIETILCIDADRRAVECAQENIADPRAKFIWADLSRPVDGVGDLDFIIMNPPFHEGKKTMLSLGQDFIRMARAALKKGGRLYMVANAQLDYESVLRASFAHGDKYEETGGFKVFCAKA